jgi:hypothetical protein
MNLDEISHRASGRDRAYAWWCVALIYTDNPEQTLVFVRDKLRELESYKSELENRRSDILDELVQYKPWLDKIVARYGGTHG